MTPAALRFYGSHAALSARARDMYNIGEGKAMRHSGEDSLIEREAVTIHLVGAHGRFPSSGPSATLLRYEAPEPHPCLIFQLVPAGFLKGLRRAPMTGRAR